MANKYLPASIHHTTIVKQETGKQTLPDDYRYK